MKTLAIVVEVRNSDAEASRLRKLLRKVGIELRQRGPLTVIDPSLPTGDKD